MDIKPRTHSGRYNMRGTVGRPSDEVTYWERVINRQRFEFERIAWEGGKSGVTLTVRRGGAMEPLHRIHTAR